MIHIEENFKCPYGHRPIRRRLRRRGRIDLPTDESFNGFFDLLAKPVDWLKEGVSSAVDVTKKAVVNPLVSGVTEGLAATHKEKKPEISATSMLLSNQYRVNSRIQFGPNLPPPKPTPQPTPVPAPTPAPAPAKSGGIDKKLLFAGAGAVGLLATVLLLK